uniref:Uncharacterized protein n=1 Tax=Schizaphis graminum TaxID=13262 RepID=A0A2S2NNF5_SCHGA
MCVCVCVCERERDREREGKRNNTVLLLGQSISEPAGGARDCLVTCAQPSSSHYLWKFFGVCVCVEYTHFIHVRAVDRKNIYTTVALFYRGKIFQLRFLYLITRSFIIKTHNIMLILHLARVSPLAILIDCRNDGRVTYVCGDESQDKRQERERKKNDL